MLAKKYRLTKQKDFQVVFRGGKKIFSRFFGVRYQKNDLDNPRFAVVASVKVSKKAVVRNRLKRQTREIIKEQLKDITASSDIIVNILSRSIDVDYIELEKDLAGVLKKVSG